VFYSAMFFVIVRIMLYFSERALTATKDRAYDDMLALLTHQLRHPNSAISAIIDAMESDKRATFNKPAAHYVELLKRENNSALHLVTNLLEAARPAQSHKYDSPVDIGVLLAEVAQRAASDHKRIDDLRLNIAVNDVVLQADRQKLYAALDNIMH